MENAQDSQLINVGYKVYSAEFDINDQKQLYLITWSPDPSKLPNCDFENQHLFNVNILSNYLKTCSAGLFCVEATQMGNPHYHGWYQVNEETELGRIALAKTLAAFGKLKITKSLGHYRINSYSKNGNCLYYYKKDLTTSMLNVKCNPIDKDTVDDTNWNTHIFFFDVPGKRKSVADLEAKIVQYKFYEEFYKKST